MGVWRPEEHYIWIEPNVKFLLSSPNAARYAPVPWYNRPPPRPSKPGPPPDKLRYVSTRRIHNAFDSDPFGQTVADDLDSLLQTFMNALLKRTGYMPGLLAQYGNQDLWQLKAIRDEAYDEFWRVSQRQQSKKEARRRELAKAKEATKATEASNTEVESHTAVDEGNSAKEELEPEGVAAFVDPLWKLMKLSGVLTYAETRAGSEWRQPDSQEARARRAAENYEKFTAAMQEVYEGAALAEKRAFMRKAAKKAKKAKEAMEVDEDGKAAAPDVEKASTKDDAMDVDEEAPTDTALAGCVANADEEEDDETGHGTETATDDRGDRTPSPDNELDDAQTRPKKRVRIE